MSDGADELVSVIDCKKCGKYFRWQINVAGKKVRCNCGQILEVPSTPPPPRRLNPAAADEKKPVAKSKTPPESSKKKFKTAQEESPAPVPAAAADPTSLGGLYAQAMGGGTTAVQRALEEREDEIQPSIWREKVVPVVVIIFGVIAQYGSWLVLTHYEPKVTMGEAMAGATVQLLLQIILYLPIAVGSTFAAANMMQLGFGELWSTILKLAAILIFPIAFVDVIFFSVLVGQEFDFRVMLIGVALYLILASPLVWLLFETDLNETVILAGVFMAPRFVAVFLLVPPAKGILIG